MSADMHCNHLARSPAEKDALKILESLMPEAEEKAPEAAQHIYCRQCFRIITSPDERIIVHGSHQHTFANPNGLVFEIGCFRTAEGCGYAGRPTTEFTWFKGYSWRIALCSKCLSHIGWLFTSTGAESFAGLILDRLVYSK